MFSIRKLFVKIRRYSPTPPAFDAPVGVTPVEFHGDLRHQKTRVSELLHGSGIVSIILCSAILVQLRLVTDGQTQTHKQTCGNSKYCTVRARTVKQNGEKVTRKKKTHRCKHTRFIGVFR